MPPKAKAAATATNGTADAGHAGMTKKQQEELALQQLQELSKDFFAKAHQPAASAKSAKSAKTKQALALAKQQKTEEQLLQRRNQIRDEFQEAQRDYLLSCIYRNEPVTMSESYFDWQPASDRATDVWIRYDQFKMEYLKPIVNLLTVSLSEPYNAFTYEHFLSGWPDLGVVVFGVKSATKPAKTVAGEIIGTVVSKVSRKHPGKPLRGYIAMLAVAEAYRGHRLGQKLVTLTVELMKKKKVDEVCLETPVTNDRALNLYLGLGFVKHKFLTRYYLDGQDAVRLKLWLTSPFEGPTLSADQHQKLARYQKALALAQQIEAQMSSEMNMGVPPPLEAE